MTIELYRDRDLVVRATTNGLHHACVVTFDNLGSPADLEAPGFGEQFLASRGIDAVVVRGRGDHWYHYPGTPAALAAVAQHVAPYGRVVTYGSSMGGYAAWRFAAIIGADACLALSPQFSIRPDVVPFEYRWTQEAGRIAWMAELERPPDRAFTAVIAYDGRGPDRLHAALIASQTPIAAVALPFGGHPVATALASAGMLEPLLMATVRGDLDPERFQRDAIARRRADPMRLIELARRLPPRRRALAIALARRALASRPESDLAHYTLAVLLAAAGDHAEAVTLHRRAGTLGARFFGYQQAYSEALFGAGDLAGAIEVARAAAAQRPDQASIHSWLGQLLWAAGDRPGAFEHAERAVELSPFEQTYAETLALYHHRQTWPVRSRRALARAARRLGFAV